MSYSQIGGVIGGVIGYYFGQPQLGYAIGASIGAAAQPKEQIQGPRLEDLKVTGSEYGAPIPWVQGYPRISGGVWWSSEKREIANVEETGKGGGAEVTTFTYEVDMLVGLTDNVITGVRRIWSNGKLVWSASSDATDETVQASADNAPWRDITIMRGAADQLPHPVYEAAVGSANACAYRGRGAVLIEGLQLGGSGIMPNLTFEVVVDGDTEAGSPVRLQTYFEAGDSADVSNNAIGDGVLVGNASVDPGGYFIHAGAEGSSADRSGTLTWEDAVLAAPLPGVPWTFEAIISIGSARNVSYDPVLSYWKDASDVDSHITIGVEGTNGMLVFKTSGETFLGPETIGISRLHVAVVSDGTSETRVYCDGLVVHASSAITEASTPAAGRLILGGVASGSGTGYSDGFSHTVHEVRVIAKEVYTGAAFDPPTTLPQPFEFNLIGVTPTTLQTVVERLCGTIGLTSAEFDATALSSITRPVRGLAVGQVSAARKTLEVLAAGFFFESSLSDKLRFRPRAVTPVGEIAYTDLAAGNDGPNEDPLAIAFAGDVEVPAQFAVTYINKTADDQTATERSDRMISSQASVSAVSMPLGLLPEEAKGIADAILADTMAATSSTMIRVPLSYAAFEPGDVVTVNDADGQQLRMRLVRRTDALGVLTFEAVVDDVGALTSAGVTDEGYDEQTEVLLLADTVMVLMDVPLLRDDDDGPGWYVAARGTNANWPGAVIRQSADDTTFSTAAEVRESAVLGACLSTLGDFTGGYVFDEINSLTVDVDHGELSSATRDAILNDRSLNALQVGAEVIQFRTATLTSDGVYVLTGLLRGRGGTEWAIGGHVSGERCVLLRPRGLRRVGTQFSDIGQLRYVKGVTLGKLQDSAPSQEFTNTGVSSKPLAVVDLREGLVDGVTECTWKRRSRLSTKFMGTTGAVVPLGEPTERYQVEIYEPGPGGALLDTVIVTEARIGTVTGSGGGGGTVSSGAVAKTWAKGVGFPHEYGGHLFGVDVEGNGSRTLVKMNSAGEVVGTSFVLGDIVSDVVYNGSTCYAIGHFLYPNGVYELTRIYRIDLDTLSTLVDYYTPATPGDAAGLAWDGTDLWSTGYFSGDLRKHDAVDLTVSVDYAIEPLIWGIQYAGSGQFIIGVANSSTPKVLRYAPGGAPVVWDTDMPLNSVPQTPLLVGGLIFVGGGASVFVLNATSGAIVETHTGGRPYYLPHTGAQGLTAFGGYVYYKTAAHLPFVRLDASTGAFFDSGIALPVTTLTGEVGGNLFGVRSPNSSYLTYRGYEITLSAGADTDSPGGALDGLRLVVRQIGQNDILGYPAEITL